MDNIPQSAYNAMALFSAAWIAGHMTVLFAVWLIRKII